MLISELRKRVAQCALAPRLEYEQRYTYAKKQISGFGEQAVTIKNYREIEYLPHQSEPLSKAAHSGNLKMVNSSSNMEQILAHILWPELGF
ncbi:uncharacterized protein N7443_003793 [Penicillium atrosanguineum]|uniref:uncharacterized protein n=1 Tax=Penicillium atrosanguineum TaxID=1132637 RepID=UPI0023A3E3F7|nr:uncharacterized protein N7443_003793 [Penicillium atrosanguineum]KAJ5304133.1 hypothetical protein N7443_003793 [Penicillium atrosanguineum]